MFIPHISFAFLLLLLFTLAVSQFVNQESLLINLQQTARPREREMFEGGQTNRKQRSAGAISKLIK
jgi:hypothetical protein